MVLEPLRWALLQRVEVAKTRPRRERLSTKHDPVVVIVSEESPRPVPRGNGFSFTSRWGLDVSPSVKSESVCAGGVLVEVRPDKPLLA